ncbi:MAG: tetratricopeptide repeat protein [Bacteroidota bacterium]
MLKKNKEWFLLALILLVTFVVFSPVLKYDFVNWDDGVNVYENANVRELNAGTLKNMFSTTVIGGYTPLTTLSFAVENSLFGMKPGVFHLNNLLLHLLNTLLVFILFRKLGINLFITFTVALLFGIHPMRVESVAWITERKDMLYGFFFLLSLIFYVAFRKQKKPVYYILAFLAFILSLLSKIQAVALPLILILIDFFFERKFRLKSLLNKIPFFVLALATGIAGLYILGQEGTLETHTVLPFFQRIFIGTWSFCVYLAKSIVPYPLSAIYPNPDGLTVYQYGSALLVLVLAILIYKSGKLRDMLVFGSLFFLCNVIFVLQIVGAGQAYLADRFTYLAYIGLFFLIGWALNFLMSGKWKPLVIGLGLTYAAILGIVSWNRVQVWKNSETLFSDVVKKYPEAEMAHMNLGYYYRDLNQNEKAIASYTRAIEIKPLGYMGYSNRGEVLFGLGQLDKALGDMNKAILLKPDYAKALSNRGALYGSQKKYDLALADLDSALSMDPHNERALTNRLLVYYNMGDYEKASRDASSFLAIKPGNADILNQRGLCLDQLNKNKEALADFNEAIAINPKKGYYYQNRSYLLAKTGDPSGALKDILKARELGIKVNPAYLQMLQSQQPVFR